MFTKLIRVIFTLVGVALGFGFYALCGFLLGLRGTDLGDILPTETERFILAAACAIIFGIIFYRLTPSIGRQGEKVAKSIERDMQGIPTDDVLSSVFGLIVGLVIAYLISQIYNTIPVPFVGTALSVVTYLICAYLGMVVIGRRGKNVLTFLRRDIREQSVAPNARKKGKAGEAMPKILDTSVIIDGRISDIMKTGFIEGKIIIPEFVLGELQYIADSSDSLKRNRGRRGLDVLRKIQSEYGIEIYDTTSEKGLDEIPEVDIKLLKLAQSMNGKVVTNDYNLNKVATIQGVEVLNINELANTLKPVVLPGESMSLFLVKEGKEPNQGVAYLDDGTMIVVEDGRKYIGQTINAVVTSVLQTSAGRMIFAKTKSKK